MRNLNYDLKELCNRNRHGSFSTQSNRRHILDLIANQLHELGYRQMRARSLKPKHVEALVDLWEEHDLTVGTIKNRLCAIRWWAARVDKSSVVEASNDAYGIGKREHVGKESQAQRLNPAKLDKIADPYTRLSVQLQALFGLRRAEAIHFQPQLADHGTELRLKPTWCKGKRARTVPVRTEQQRALLAKVHDLCRGGALIAPENNFVTQLRRYEHHIRVAGFRKLHGLRHQYAQDRFWELAGFPCPLAGGPKKAEMTPEEQDRNHRARLIVTRELGHAREEITAKYLGR